MATELPEKIRRLQVHVGAGLSGELVRDSQYVFTYASDAADQPAVALLMPPSQRLVYQDGDLFPSMDMNLPEGYLFQRIKELHPKQQLSKMHMLALIGANGIGRIGYRLPGTQPPAVVHMAKADILSRSADGSFFSDLVNAYLSTGAGISGVQPKIMVPSRATTPVPDLIVKTQGPDFAGLAANECAARADERIPREVPGLMQAQWDIGMAYATETSAMRHAGVRFGPSAEP